MAAWFGFRRGLTHRPVPRRFAGAGVAAETALSVLACNLTRLMNIVGIKPLMAAMSAWRRTGPAFSPASPEWSFCTARALNRHQRERTRCSGVVKAFRTGRLES